jgi:hypothetical protein
MEARDDVDRGNVVVSQCGADDERRPSTPPRINWRMNSVRYCYQALGLVERSEHQVFRTP